MQGLLNSARKNGVNKGLNEERLYVKSIICGKGTLFKKLDIKGRGRMGIIRVPKCTVKLVLEEKNPLDYYKMVLSGNTSPGLGQQIRNMVFQSDFDFE